MDIKKMKTEDLTGFIIAICGSIVAAGWWVVNNVLTNKSKITLLEQRTDMMISLMKEMREDQKEMRRDIKLIPR
jgi:hypothetical protein